MWPTQTLTLLGAGPDAAELAANLTSEVPAGLGPVTVTDAPGTVEVVVSVDVTTLSAAAVDQIVCTVRFELDADEHNRWGRLVEYDVTEKIFTNPVHKRTEDYVSGKVG